MQTKTILLADDDSQYVKTLRSSLEKDGYEVMWAQTAAEVMSKVSLRPTALIMDFMRGQAAGLDLCKQLREMPESKKLPIIFLTRKAEETDEAAGLDVGADDFIRKSVSNRVISARLRNVLRRALEQAPSIESNDIKLGALEINRITHDVKLHGKTVFLPRKEFELLWLLAQNKGKVFSREILLRRVWGENIYVTERTVDVHVCKVRQRLGSFGQENLETIKGIGYRLKA
jgi:two-component system, OmpR family, alkaline phosphatase synthesis response regulator PhoP